MNANTNFTVIGVDLAKNVFQLHFVDEETGEVKRLKLNRQKFQQFFINRAPCLIGMEACGGSHYWAREFLKLGHQVKVMPVSDVKAFNSGNKSDARDAQAIWAATRAGTTRDVAVKTEEQQAILSMHRILELKKIHRVGLTNQIRGLLAEFGLVVPTGFKALREGLPKMLEELEQRAPKMFCEQIQDLWQDILRLREQENAIDQKLSVWAKTNSDCQRLMEIPGVGLLTATAVVATVGNARVFKNGRQLAAFFGVAPAHTGSGGKIQVLWMSKRGDCYVRKLLVHCARTSVLLCKDPPKVVDRLKKKHHVNVVIGAMANRLCRIIWALMKHETKYVKDYQHLLT